MSHLLNLYRLVFQNLLMATNKAVRDASQTTWTALLHAASGSNLQLAVSSDHASMLFSLACTPIGMQLPQQHLLVFPMPAGGDEGSWSGMQQLVGAEEGFDVAAMRLSVAAALGQLAHQFCFLGKLYGCCLASNLDAGVQYLLIFVRIGMG